MSPPPTPGAEREHDHVLGSRDRRRAGARRARPRWRRSRSSRARRSARARLSRRSTPASGMFTEVTALPPRWSIVEGMPTPMRAMPSRPARRSRPRPGRGAPSRSTTSVARTVRRTTTPSRSTRPARSFVPPRSTPMTSWRPYRRGYDNRSLWLPRTSHTASTGAGASRARFARARQGDAAPREATARTPTPGQAPKPRNGRRAAG